jgi:hypothetical protein
MLSYFRSRIVRPYLLAAAVAFTILAWEMTALHYTGGAYGNDFAWISWLLAVASFCGAFVRFSRPSFSVRTILRSEVGIALALLLLYLPTHLWNFPVAPWNTNGLFDDAAWDIYFAKIHAFNGPFQAAWFDTVGYISRETVYHYYITAFFKVFGYNLLVFIGSLLVLGFVTVLATTLIVHRLFHNRWVTVAAAVVLNFFPIEFLHIFVGHRYAIAAPLMMVSLYFLYSGFQDRSFFRVALSAFFAALCLDSAIMGKQYILALAVTAVLLPLVDKRWRSPEARALALAWFGGFVIAATPLLVYVVFNATDYFRREGGLLTAFAAEYAAHGIDGVRPFFEQVAELFFANDTYERQWLHDFPVIPLAYYPLLLAGLGVALVRRRLELFFLALIPVGSAFLSGAYEFRVLLAVPVWVICIGFALDAVARQLAARRTAPRSTSFRPWLAPLVAATTAGLLILGVLPSAKYLLDVSGQSHRQYLFAHKDVAVARYVQDIVAGSATPSVDMKADEFNRRPTAAAAEFDSLVCPAHAYAVMHVYLQDFDDRRILAFCDQGIEALQDSGTIIHDNVAAIEAYQPAGKALKLIWQDDPNAQPAIERFRQYETFGAAETLSGSVEGESFSLYVLTIPSAQLGAFQARVATDSAAGQL